MSGRELYSRTPPYNRQSSIPFKIERHTIMTKHQRSSSFKANAHRGHDVPALFPARGPSNPKRNDCAKRAPRRRNAPHEILPRTKPTAEQFELLDDTILARCVRIMRLRGNPNALH